MRLMRVDEAAERLGLKPATIRKMIFRREIPVVRPTKRAVRIREDDVEALIRLGLTPSRREGRP
jgi:excisionase family DNA binding protein